MSEATLQTALEKAKLLVFCGSGGVGKTTASAALALQAALNGRKVLVLTIDPAQRLLQALGLHGQGHPANTPLEVLPRMAEVLGVKPQQIGTLHAMMLDAETGATAMFARLLPDPLLHDQVLNNRVYRAFLPALAASPDYIALELIYNLTTDPRFDLLILDTPPMHNAMDFLHASDTLSSFINERVLKWFAKVPLPGQKSRFSFLNTGGSMAMSVLGRLFGSDTVPDIAQFFSSFRDVLPRLRDRAAATQRMLRAPTTRFVIVTAPGETSLREARHLHAELREQAMPFAGFIVNRCLQPDIAWPMADQSPPTVDAALAGRLQEGLQHLHLLVDADAAQIAMMRQLAGPKGFCQAVPQREQDIHTLLELRDLAQRIVQG